MLETLYIIHNAECVLQCNTIQYNTIQFILSFMLSSSCLANTFGRVV